MEGKEKLGRKREGVRRDRIQGKGCESRKEDNEKE